MIRLAFIEDDAGFSAHLRENLEVYAGMLDEPLKVSGFENAEQFLQTERGAFDILLLDIQLPGMDGMSLARRIREKDTDVEIIFVTNSPQYAIEGYKVGALDYILKPVNPEAMKKTLNAAVDRCRSHRQDPQIVVRVKGGSRKIAVSRIRYIEVRDHAMTIYTNDEEIEAYGTIREMEEVLREEPFFHCNKGYLIHLAYVDGMVGQDIYLGSTVIPVGRNRKKAFLEAMNAYLNR